MLCVHSRQASRIFKMVASWDGLSHSLRTSCSFDEESEGDSVEEDYLNLKATSGEIKR